MLQGNIDPNPCKVFHSNTSFKAFVLKTIYHQVPCLCRVRTGTLGIGSASRSPSTSVHPSYKRTINMGTCPDSLSTRARTSASLHVKLRTRCLARSGLLKGNHFGRSTRT
jgi:hypothetical protein